MLPMNELYPIFLKTEQLRFLIVGGGNVALEKLEFLIKPLSSHLDEKEFKGNSGVTPIYGPSIRDDLENKYKDELIHSLKKTRKVGDRKHIPIKKNILLNEEIFITIMNILKKQQEEIEQLKNKE